MHIIQTKTSTYEVAAKFLDNLTEQKLPYIYIHMYILYTDRLESKTLEGRPWPPQEHSIQEKALASASSSCCL